MVVEDTRKVSSSFIFLFFWVPVVIGLAKKKGARRQLLEQQSPFLFGFLSEETPKLFVSLPDVVLLMF